MRRSCLSSLSLVVFFFLIASAWVQAADKDDAFVATKRLGRGINLGNALEAPNEGEWGVTLQADYFAAIRRAGFDSVRLPVKWSNHAKADAPYTMDNKFFERIDWAIAQTLKNDLAIIVNVHHYDEMQQDPDAHAARLVGLWQQIAERYQKQPATVYFELLNEPNSKLTDEKWNALFPKLLEVVRQTNPGRYVIVGPSHWNSVHNLKNLKLPGDDQRLIATFHYYLPFEFTHQGAPWQEGADKWLGRTWPRTEEESRQLEKDFQAAADWSKAEKRPLLLGEFGVYSAADMKERTKWTAAVRREAERHGFAWSYWEFCSGFGAYDPQTDKWREPLLKALVD